MSNQSLGHLPVSTEHFLLSYSMQIPQLSRSEKNEDETMGTNSHLSFRVHVSFLWVCLRGKPGRGYRRSSFDTLPSWIGGRSLFRSTLRPHSHSKYSLDAASCSANSPDKAFRYGRDTARLSFVAICDHAEEQNKNAIPSQDKKQGLSNWESLLKAGQKYNNEDPTEVRSSSFFRPGNTRIPTACLESAVR